MKTYLEPEEVSMVERVATNLRDRLLIRVLFHLGCRVSEALALEVKNIDFEQGVVTIQHLKSRLKLLCPECRAALGKEHHFCPHCGARVDKALTRQQEHQRQRVLPLDDGTLNLLREYVRRGGPVIRGGKRYIYGINRHRAWQIIRDCAEEAGLPKLVNPETGKHIAHENFSTLYVPEPKAGSYAGPTNWLWAAAANRKYVEEAVAGKITIPPKKRNSPGKRGQTAFDEKYMYFHTGNSSGWIRIKIDEDWL